jgi:hypothetical protein
LTLKRLLFNFVIKTQILCSISFLPPAFENRDFYEIMLKNIVERKGHRWCMGIAGYKHIHTHSEYVKRTAFPLQQWFHEHASMLLYTYIVLFELRHIRFDAT